MMLLEMLISTWLLSASAQGENSCVGREIYINIPWISYNEGNEHHIFASFFMNLLILN